MVKKRSFLVFLAAICALGAGAAYLFFSTKLVEGEQVKYFDLIVSGIKGGEYAEFFTSIEAFMSIGFVAALALAGLLGIFGSRKLKPLISLFVCLALICFIQLYALSGFALVIQAGEFELSNFTENGILAGGSLSILSILFLALDK